MERRKGDKLHIIAAGQHIYILKYNNCFVDVKLHCSATNIDRWLENICVHLIWLDLIACYYLDQGSNETKKGNGHSILPPGLFDLDQQVAVITGLHSLSTRKKKNFQYFLLPLKIKSDACQINYTLVRTTIQLFTLPYTLSHACQRVGCKWEETSMVQTGPHLKEKKTKQKNIGKLCEEDSRAQTYNHKCHFLFKMKTSSILTFPGILAASTERQFTQEAITSTGGLMTDVNLTNSKQ